jgi:hypothetical protein
MALEAGLDFLISIDDDNFCRAEADFFREHSIVCKDAEEVEAIHDEGGWFNVCELLELEPPCRIYPRGFPYHHRHPKDSNAAYGVEHKIVRMNAGLWLLEPDLDAMSWLALPVRANSFKGRSVVLGDETWSPINTQNTALNREVIPCYYFIRMGYPIEGMRVDRYGDIFSGYFSQACVRHHGHSIRVGTPVADHRRNSHNYILDASRELACIWVLEDLTAWLRQVKLEGSSYIESYISLSYMLEDAVEKFSGLIWTDSTRGYFHQMAYSMRQWASVCKSLT